MFAYHPEEVLYDNTGEPSPYELEMERLRMDKLLQSQVRKYGDDAMRTQPTIALDDSAMPTEDFQRSCVLRIPGVKIAKPAAKDPLAGLLKAMNVRPVPNTGRNTGNKTNRALVKGENGGEPRFDESNGRPTWRRGTGESPEEFARHPA